MTADAFTSARPEFQRALSKAARPMPPAFGEVAVLRGRRIFGLTVRDALIGLISIAVAIVGIMALAVMVTP